MKHKSDQKQHSTQIPQNRHKNVAYKAKKIEYFLFYKDKPLLLKVGVLLVYISLSQYLSCCLIRYYHNILVARFIGHRLPSDCMHQLCFYLILRQR